MKNIDMHLHLFPKLLVEKEGDWSGKELEKNFTDLFRRIKKADTEKGLVIILDTDFLKKRPAVDFLKIHKKWFSDFPLCFMFDFRKPKDAGLIPISKNLGAKAIKFHPYLQKITEKEYPLVEVFAKKAEAAEFLTVIDASYGTKHLDKYNGVKLAGFLSQKISSPILIAHAGGAKVLDAMLVALDAPNIYIDISFSLQFYLGSSIENDIAFATKKLGSHRWMYGSDPPFVAPDVSLKTAETFFKKFKFGKKDQENILFNTADKLLF